LKQHDRHIVGIYCRLSRDDDNDSESESIANQKKMITRYVRERGWSIHDFYVDDGVSGTTFNRPEFMRMIKDIDDNKLNTVITKDLSRLGRDYILTGHYIEIYFPEKNIRYIAINDGIDTDNSDNDIAPFKNILNEMYAKDISKKVRAAFKTKAENGEFIGAFAPYGYMKHPEDKNKLVVNKDTVGIVKRIFSMAAQGYGLNRISRVLNLEEIPNPTMYARESGLNYVNNLRMNKTYYWTNTTIRKMLNNKVYIGVLAQGKQRTKSFKCKKKVNRDEKDWIEVENCHEPIINKELWETVQKKLKVRKRSMSNGMTHLFSGLIKCEDCGRFMALGRKSNGYMYFVCGTYKNYGPDHCSRHGINYEFLYNIVMEDIRYHARLAECNEDAIVQKLMSVTKTSRESLRDSIKKEYQALDKRNIEIDNIYKQMYEDRIRGKLTDARFDQLCIKYDEEQQRLTTKLCRLNEKLEELELTSNDIDYWIDTVRNYTEIAELDKTIVNELIDKITIGEKKEVDGNMVQEINISYKFVGCIG